MRSPRVLFLLALLACDGDGTTDPTPPATPTALTATLSGSNIVVQWGDNSADETEFTIEFARNNESFVPLAMTAANVTTYTHANVDRGQIYRYRVRACNGSECSAFAGPVETAVPLLAPSVVTENATSVTGTSATLRATVNPNAGATTVQFEYGTDATLRGSAFTAMQNVTAGTTATAVTADVTGLQPSSTYYVRAIATNSGGTTQGDIRTFATPITIPAMPIAVFASQASPTQITVGWQPGVNAPSSPATEYRIEARSAGGAFAQVGTTTPPATAFSHTNLAVNATYTYRVRACNAAGCSAYSSEVTATTVATPPTVVSSTVTPSHTSALVSATVNPNGVATNVTVEYGTNANLSSATVTSAQPAGNGTTNVQVAIPVNSLNAGTTYYYRVVAQSAAGSSLSSIGSFATSAGPSQAPIVTATAATGVGQTAATLNGTVNPNGSATTARFEWGISPTLSSGTNFTSLESVGSGTNATPFSAMLTGLAPATTYYYRVVAGNSAGQSTSNTQSFTTAAGTSTVTLNASASNNRVTVTWTSSNCAQTGSLARRRNGSNEGDYENILSNAAANGSFVDETYDVRYDSYTWRITLCGLTEFATLTGLRVAAPALSITSVASNRIDLSWTDPSGGQLAFILAKRSNGVETSINLPAGTTAYSDNAVTNGTEYGYDIRYGRSSERSNVVAATPPGAATLPTATTNAATGVTPSAATLNGTVNPNGSATTAQFQWNTSPTLAGSINVTSVQAMGSGSSNVAVTATVSGLSPSSTYYYRVVANNAAGQALGSIQSFTTAAPAPPTVTTTAATSVTHQSAQLNGTVNPNGAQTTRWFEWGDSPTLATFSSTPSASVGSGTSPVSMTAAITGLAVSTTYYYRAVAQSVGGTTHGAIMSFTTTAGAPTITISASPSNYQVTLTWSSTNCSQTGTIARRRNNSNDEFDTTISTSAPPNGSFTDDTYDIRYSSFSWRITLCGVSEMVTVTGLSVPNPVLAITAVTSGRIDLSWTDQTTGQIGFVLYKRSQGTETQINLPAGTTTYSDTAVTPGVEYGYDIRSARSSGRSNVVAATPPT